jgi:DNA-binding LacI/PurR family transcriptional regulator
MYKPDHKRYANTLNLSCSTVSRSLLGQKTWLKNNYQSFTVADSFFSQAIAGIESVAYEKGYSVLVSQRRMPKELLARNAQRSV